MATGKYGAHSSHTHASRKILHIIPQGDNTTLVLSFTISVQINQFGTTNKSKILHRTVKTAVSDVSESFWTHLWVEPNLDAPVQNSLSYSGNYEAKNQWTTLRNTRRSYQPI